MLSLTEFGAVMATKFVLLLSFFVSIAYTKIVTYAQMGVNVTYPGLWRVESHLYYHHYFTSAGEYGITQEYNTKICLRYSHNQVHFYSFLYTQVSSLFVLLYHNY